MKKILIPCLFLLVSCFSLSGCDKEDGNILDWVGEYFWVSNVEEHWHMFITGEKSKKSENNYPIPESKFKLIIREDKTWFQPNSDKIATSGYSGKIKCYQDYICFVDMPSNYYITNKMHFKYSIYNETTYLEHYNDESVGKHGIDYDFTKRNVRLSKAL